MMTNPNGNPAPQVEEPQHATCSGTEATVRTAGDTHDGTLVGLSNDGLVISTAENRQHSFIVAKDAYVCCDGVTCGIDTLKLGGRVRLTAHANDQHVATIVESLTNDSDFADHH